ncbi:hypothetical protein MG296_03670 [Flavobacteriaceae bacterium TK19130]|nr:hypothetical protein [Thermobacterium salinum]
MKNLTRLSLLIFPLVFLSCSPDAMETEETSTHLITDTNFEEFCYETPLIAGQNEIAGTVSIVYVDDAIEIRYETNDDWTLKETHLFVGDCEDMPINGGGNPKIGQFPLAENHGGNTAAYAYSINPTEYPECVCIAAHAVVKSTTSNKKETAWAEGQEFPGNSWAMYFDYCLDYCDGD